MENPNAVTKDRDKVHASLHQKLEYMAFLSLLMPSYPISFEKCLQMQYEQISILPALYFHKDKCTY